MKKSTLLLIIYLALSNCSISIESKSNQKSPSVVDRSSWISKGGYQSIDYDNFIQNQTIIRGERSIQRIWRREVDIVPSFSERVKFGNYLPCTVIQLDWTYGIKTQVLV